MDNDPLFLATIKAFIALDMPIVSLLQAIQKGNTPCNLQMATVTCVIDRMTTSEDCMTREVLNGNPADIEMRKIIYNVLHHRFSIYLPESETVSDNPEAPALPEFDTATADDEKTQLLEIASQLRSRKAQQS
jgi:hypothetical protein